MRTCDFTESFCYDPTGELAEPCKLPKAGECAYCEADFCLNHGVMCYCGQTFCQNCRASHEISCSEFKLREYRRVKKYTEQRA